MNKFIVIFIFILLIIWSLFIEPNLLTVKHFEIESLKGTKLVFVSDFHSKKADSDKLIKIVNLINKQNPDIVLSCGDFINDTSEKDSLTIEEQAEILSKIKAPFITVLGNHDCINEKDKIIKTFSKYGIKVLVNENTYIGNLCIAGIDDLTTGTPDIDRALGGTNKPRILLTHNPDVYYKVFYDVNLILAGHLHGGQVSLPIIGPLILPSKYGVKFSKYIINETKNMMLITKGIGTSILPIRFGATPEIIVIN